MLETPILREQLELSWEEALGGPPQSYSSDTASRVILLDVISPRS